MVSHSREEREDVSLGPDGRRPDTPVAYDETGVDRSLIRAALDLEVAERLDIVDAYAQEIEELRAAVHRR